MQKNSIYCFRGIETDGGIRWSLSGIIGQSVPLPVIDDLVNSFENREQKNQSCTDIEFEDVTETQH